MALYVPLDINCSRYLRGVKSEGFYELLAVYIQGTQSQRFNFTFSKFYHIYSHSHFQFHYSQLNEKQYNTPNVSLERTNKRESMGVDDNLNDVITKQILPMMDIYPYKYIYWDLGRLN